MGGGGAWHVGSGVGGLRPRLTLLRRRKAIGKERKLKGKSRGWHEGTMYFTVCSVMYQNEGGWS